MAFRRGPEDPKHRAEGGVRFPLSPRHWRGLFRLRRAILRAQRHQNLDADSPPFVMLTDSSAQLLTQARILAADDREDSEAVSELVRLADGNQQALQIAALGARENGVHHESSWGNLTHRLLQAAIVDGSVVPLTVDEHARFTLLDDFAEMPVSDQWDRLTELQPRLTDLTGRLSVEQLARHLTSTEVVELPPLERGPIRTARRTAREYLKGGLAPLVGPQSLTDDPILSSQIAFKGALKYLMEVDDNYPQPQDN
jgi:hypothetical protein